MAGSERSGVTAARADLFDGAYWLLTPTHDSDPDVFSAVHALVSAVGARVISVDAEAHDEAVAIVSHVPHVAAAALVDLAAAHSGERGELMRLAAGGFKDTTRIAAGSSDLWTGICLDNADALAEGLEELRERLGGFEALVRARDADAIRAWLEGAAEVRRSLPAQWVPATAQLTELSVPMLDRPGVVAEITGAVSRAGCNIEGIDIDHETEDSAVLVLVLTDEGDQPALVADLRRAWVRTPCDAARRDGRRGMSDNVRTRIASAHRRRPRARRQVAFAPRGALLGDGRGHDRAARRARLGRRAREHRCGQCARCPRGACRSSRTARSRAAIRGWGGRGPRTPHEPIDCGNSGTTARLLMGSARRLAGAGDARRATSRSRAGR